MNESSYVKGPLTRSNRMPPVLMIIRRGIVERDGLVTVAPSAVGSKLKILPFSPKGLHEMYRVSGAHP